MGGGWMLWRWLLSAELWVVVWKRVRSPLDCISLLIQQLQLHPPACTRQQQVREGMPAAASGASIVLRSM